ncbi:hypothetical protein CDAR_446511 [Caerostris darwini]|uniref:Uncharacterized protein n=1 Tax=Caerostris darwini TaxID=1538125 RepID=A0AAV4PLG4_9ARAC|nr:hypothetical protein CDAR_446511 [Caerostris darwini]
MDHTLNNRVIKVISICLLEFHPLLGGNCELIGDQKVVAVQKQLSAEKIKLIDDHPLRPTTFTKPASSVIPSYDVYSITDKLAEAKHVTRLRDERRGVKAKSNQKIVKKIFPFNSHFNSILPITILKTFHKISFSCYFVCI